MYSLGMNYLYDTQRGQPYHCNSGLNNNVLPLASQASVQYKQINTETTNHAEEKLGIYS